MKYTICIILGLFLFVHPGNIVAACSGSSPTWTAAGLNKNDVEDCLASATHGDTINLPAGTSPYWTSRLEITKTDITIQGGGPSVTVITGYGFLISPKSTGVRITGIHFKADSSTPVIKVTSGTEYSGTPVTDWVIDGNRFTAAGSGCLSIHNGSTGLIADNEFYISSGTPIYVYGRDDLAWSTHSFFGTNAQYVFIEDNKFISTGKGTANHIALSAWGGSYTLRCNTITNDGNGAYFKDMVDVHGYGHGTGRRSGRAIEVYGNYFDNENYQSRTVNLRGGSGRVFANRWTNPSTFIGLTDYRMTSYGLSMAYPTDINDCGSNTNTLPAASEAVNCSQTEGYPCCDQIGRGQDLSDGERQHADPFYFWDNKTTSGSPINIEVESGTPANYIQINRDYFQDVKPEGYKPFTYPHPSRGLEATTQCLTDGPSYAKTGIIFFTPSIQPPQDFREVQ